MPQHPELLRTTNDLDRFISDRAYSRVFVLVDSNTLEHCLHDLTQTVDTLRNVEVFEVEPGEASKDIDIVHGLYSSLIEAGADRNSCLLCLGGGVVTDLGGFVASTFKRGIPYIYVPTSLLAMVDAAIGGKNGINVGGYKNQAGTFTQPEALLQSEHWLGTLPYQQLRSGYAEMLKHALISNDTAHLETLLSFTSIAPNNLAPLIKQSAAIKIDVCAQDPGELGLRKTLNLGHTVGHAIESASHASGTPLLHGEAIARGLLFTLQLSFECFGYPEDLARRIAKHLRSVFEIAHASETHGYEPAQLWHYMLADKKNTNGEVRFVLLEQPGLPQLSVPIDEDRFTVTCQTLTSGNGIA